MGSRAFFVFLFMVAALWDNDGIFFRRIKNCNQVYTSHRPQQACGESRIDILLNRLWWGGRMELKTVMILPGHKVNTLRDRVV